MLFNKRHEKDFLKAKELIETYRAEVEIVLAREIVKESSPADRIRELAKLRDDEIISEDEFQSTKKKLLAI